MRLPLASDLISRDGTTDKDSRIKNGTVEGGDVLSRPGTTLIGSVGSGTAQGMNKNATLVIGDTFKVLNSSGAVTSSTALSPIAAGDDFQGELAAEANNAESMLIKNSKQCWIYTP